MSDRMDTWDDRTSTGKIIPRCLSPIEVREKALLEAGMALDKILMRLFERDSLHILRDPDLVDAAHKALNGIAVIIGTPWRK